MQIAGFELEDSGREDTAYEAVNARGIESLRCWIIRSTGQNQLLLRANLPEQSMASLRPIVALRTMAGTLKVTLTSTADGQASVSHTLELTEAWQMMTLPAGPPVTVDLRGHHAPTMCGIEVRFTSDNAVAANGRTPEPRDSYHAPRGGYHDSNLLGSLQPVDRIGEVPGLTEGWSVGPESSTPHLTFAPANWSPEVAVPLQPLPLTRLDIGRDARAVNLVFGLRPLTLAKLSRIGHELLVGLEQDGGDLAVRSFIRWVNADGKEAVLPLIARQQLGALELLTAQASLSPHERSLLSKGASAEFVLELTGTGSLLLGSCWLGRGDLPLARPGMTDRLRDLALREWHYQRFLETRESPLRAMEPQARFACFLSTDGLPDETKIQALVTASVASIHGQGSLERLLICIPQGASGATEMAIHAALAAAIPRQDLHRVIVVAQATPAEMQVCCRDFLAELPAEQFVLMLQAGDVLRADLSRWLARAAADRPDIAAVVFDHDHLDVRGRRSEPCLKPGLSADLLLEVDYIGRGAALRAGVWNRHLELGARPLLHPFAMRDLLLRLFAEASVIVKCDAVLLHLGQAAAAPDHAAQHDFIAAVLAREGMEATIERRGPALLVKPRPPGEPLVSIVIPLRNRADLLRRCVISILERTRYPNFEIILVDNRSSDAETLALLADYARHPRIRIVPFPAHFNYSAANNLGAAQAHGDFLIFLNNDTEIVSTDWIDVLVGHAARAGIGFVGARLHFPNGRLQHAGVVLGLRGLAGHALAGEHDTLMSPLLTTHTRDVSAVTGAAMCIRADRFAALGRWDERFILTGNDVEFCLRARRAGLRNIFAGCVQIFHEEKGSRSQLPVQPRDLQLSLDTYEPQLSAGDPFWNRSVSRLRGDFMPRAPIEPDGPSERLAAIERRLREMRARNLGPDTNNLGLYDIDRATLSANAARAEAYALEGAPPRSAAWFVPAFTHLYRGGLHTAFRLAAHLHRAHGISPLLVICGTTTPDFARLEGDFAQAFPGVPFRFHHHVPGRDAPHTIPDTDLAVATLWTTAYVVARHTARGKFYLIQDFEPLFEAQGASYGLIETTYRMGLLPICNSPGVAQAIAPYSDAPRMVFEPAVDRGIFRPGPERDPTAGPLRIVFYGRPGNSRNLFGLGIHALMELKAMFGEDIEILSTGASFDPARHQTEGAIRNIGLLPSLESLAALYRSCDIGLVFMQSRHPSYQPLEYMASGCVTVTNQNEANAWLLRDRENCLMAPITLTGVVETLAEAVRDAALRRRLRANGLTTVAGLDWAVVERQVARFMLDPLGLRSTSANRKPALVEG